MESSSGSQGASEGLGRNNSKLSAIFHRRSSSKDKGSSQEPSLQQQQQQYSSSRLAAVTAEQQKKQLNKAERPAQRVALQSRREQLRNYIVCSVTCAHLCRFVSYGFHGCVCACV